MNRKVLLIAITGILSFGFIACNSSQKKEKNEDETSEAVKENYQELKEELNEVGSAISDLFEAEKANFQSKADEVIDDIDRKTEEIKQRIAGVKDNEKLKARLHDLEQEADKLEKKLKELDDKTEEEWAKARQKIEEEFKKVQQEINSFFE